MSLRLNDGSIQGNSADIDPRPVYTKRELRRLSRLNNPRKHLTLYGFDFISALVIRVIIVTFCIGLVAFMNNRPFDFNLLVEGATSENFIQGFNYQNVVASINDWYDDIELGNTSLPTWLENLFNGTLNVFLTTRYLVILVVSIAYVIGWLLGFVAYILSSV